MVIMSDEEKGVEAAVLSGAATAPGAKMEPITNRKRIRGGHKAHVTKLLYEIRTITDDYADEMKAELIAKLECVHRKSELLRSFDEEIFSVIAK